eukprot:271354_1
MSTEGWRCNRCTFINSNTTVTRCEICEETYHPGITELMMHGFTEEEATRALEMSHFLDDYQHSNVYVNHMSQLNRLSSVWKQNTIKYDTNASLHLLCSIPIYHNRHNDNQCGAIDQCKSLDRICTILCRYQGYIDKKQLVKNDILSGDYQST